ncbi:hypothetical protein Bca52824_025103 [Brassica carinata]|uniref:Protein kinase domain-containing protein n=1 Tax=Brassica carinata TaxID=52824 RepID=A0A8X7VLM9_BRACI|nr:hypothetical protein Bca52824_025103 [Brassica carinata]
MKRYNNLTIPNMLLGSPSEEELGSLSEKAKLYLRQPPYHGPQSFFVVFPNVPYSAIELIKKILMFDPRQRISVEDVFDHQYLRDATSLMNQCV